MRNPQSDLELLCYWLNSGGDIRNTPEADRHFIAYYQYFAGKLGQPGPLLRFIARRLGSTAKTSPDDVLQEVFIRVAKLLKERPLIAEYIDQTAPNLRSPPYHELSRLSVKRWGVNMKKWTGDAMSFPIVYRKADELPRHYCVRKCFPINHSGLLEAKATLSRTNLLPLRVEGASFLDWVGQTTEESDCNQKEEEAELNSVPASYPRQRIEAVNKRLTKLKNACQEAKLNSEITETELRAVSNLDSYFTKMASVSQEPVRSQEPEIKPHDTAKLKEEHSKAGQATRQAEADLLAEFGSDDSVVFIEKLAKILIDSSKLPVPTKALLYTIADHQVSSHYRAKSTEETSLDDDSALFKGDHEFSYNDEDETKRHDDGTQPETGGVTDQENPTLFTQDEVEPPKPVDGEAIATLPHVYSSKSVYEAVLEQCQKRYAQEGESWIHEQSAYTMLNIPVLEAANALRAARTKHEVQQARKRYEKRRKRYAAHRLTYDLLMEGCDEIFIGQMLGMSPDDIKKRKVKDIKDEVRKLLAPLKELIKG